MTAQRITLDDRFLTNFVTPSELENYAASAADAEKMLATKNGPGNDFLGWLNLPKTMNSTLIAAIQKKADEIRSKADLLICIGIGGSYLGSKAAIEFLSPSFEDLRKPRVVFAGHSISSDYLVDLKKIFDKSEVAVNVISKSGTTTEPGIAFRVIRQWMEERYGKKGASERIVATTDPSNGALRKLVNDEGYASFEIPSDVGGRFSVLTPVGLFPIAVAGISIQKLIDGACAAMDFCSGDSLSKNMAARYAAIRNILFRKGYGIEVLAGFQPQLHFISEWWKQLSGESEGKDNTGIFPAALDYTTDLHSLGQYMQEGVRSVFETFMLIKESKNTVLVPKFADDSDDLNYLAGKSFEQINTQAFKGTLMAHLDGGVPSLVLTVQDRSEESLGQLFYFFEKAVALSGYMLRVNPFDQPGVEAYKKNMFALLGKPGFEKQGEVLRERTKDLSV